MDIKGIGDNKGWYQNAAKSAWCLHKNHTKASQRMQGNNRIQIMLGEYRKQEAVEETWQTNSQCLN